MPHPKVGRNGKKHLQLDIPTVAKVDLKSLKVVGFSKKVVGWGGVPLILYTSNLRSLIELMIQFIYMYIYIFSLIYT